MSNSSILVIGEKETFLIRILKKKIVEAGLYCEYSGWNIDEIDSKWGDNKLITIYMDSGARPSEKDLHFLKDKAAEKNVPIIIIGEKNDLNYLCDRIPRIHIYRTFVRPVDNDEYIKTAREILDKADSGEFRKSILIVDDDPNYLNLVRDWLKEPYKVSMARSGLQAIKWLGKNKVDLILLDYEMPVTSGPQVLKMLRNDLETRSIPVMFLTGKGDKESVMNVVALKPQGYFLKNIGKEELLEKLEEFFRKKK